MIPLLTVTCWIRRHLLRDLEPTCTLAEVDAAVADTLAPVRGWLLEACRARLRMGQLRYQRWLGIDQDVGYLRRAERALRRYSEDRNRERLVDAINYVVLEIAHSSIEGTHYTPLDQADTIPCPPPHVAEPAHWCVDCEIWCSSDECPRCDSTLPEISG